MVFFSPGVTQGRALTRELRKSVLEERMDAAAENGAETVTVREPHYWFARCGRLTFDRRKVRRVI